MAAAGVSALLMRRFRALLAVLLALLWLPATLHCGLEAADLLASHCAEDDGHGCSPTAADCSSDACGIVESPGYRGEECTLELEPPGPGDLVWLVHLLAGPTETMEVADAPPVDGWNRSPAWVPAWSFDRRAAAPAQAPNTLIA